MHRPRVSVPAWLCLAAALGLSAVPVASTAVSAEADKKPVQEKRQTWDEFMTIDLNAPVEELPALADAEARRQAFAARNSPENVERVAKELFALWDRSEGSPGHSQSLDSVHDEKSAVRKLFEDKQYDAALKAFRGYLIHRTAILWNARPNFASRDFYERASSTVMKRRSQDLATLSMKGVVQTGATKTTVHLGEPGLVHWEWRAKEMQNPWDNAHRPEIEYFNGSCFDKLWWKFVDTKDRAFLDRWVEFADDYTLNHHLQEDLSALNVDLGKAGLGDVMNFLLALGELSRAVPDGEELVPATTVARMMIKHLTVIIPQSLYYNREQGNNHSPPTTASYLRLAEFIYDFRIARTIEHEARRQFENYGTLQARPDGVGPGRLPGYSMFEFRENQPILQTFRDNEYEWLTPQLEREIRDRMVARARYQIATTAPSGETIVALKTDRHTASFGDTVAYLTRVLPEVFDEPEIARIANRIVRNQTQPGWDGRIHQQADKPVARLGMGGVGDEPGFASQGFPYDRTFIMSSGWDPKNDQYGVLLGSTVRGYGDSFMKENKACNHFNLSAFDQDFFDNGIDYAYNYLSSPVTVDGQTQFNGAGEGPIGRRGNGNYGLDPICTDRIHISPDVDVAEGFYDGAYANTGDHNPAYYDYKNKLEALGRCIRGVSHRRIVTFVKQHGLWVVTDLMRSEQPRDYAQQWWLAKLSQQLPEGFTEAQISADAAGRTISTAMPGRPNLTMYHVGPADLDQPGAKPAFAYAPIGLKPEIPDAFRGMRADRLEGREYIELKGSWKSRGGRSQVISVLYPRKTDADGLVSLTRLARDDGQDDGFTATLKDGAVVTYLASLEQPAALTIGDFRAVAESLLIVTERDGTVRGTVLGGKELARGGKPVGGLPPGSVDFTFTLRGAEFAFDPILRPMPPVAIAPGRNVFVDQLDVTMTSATPETEVRYTLDGNDPLITSPLYQGALRITDSAMIKARAFRKGLTRTPPPTATSTEMSLVSTAVYTREELHDANTWTTATKPGLSYDYFEAKWPRLLFGPDREVLPPLRHGEVGGLFDTSPKGENKDHAFAIAYDGYLDIPADGVYTIYAPREFTDYRPLAGYDLSLSLGYQYSWDDGKRRPANGGTRLNSWYPATRRHAFGTWSVALKKGLQPLRVYYADIRPGATLQYNAFDYPGWNVPGLTKIVWDGTVPQLDISGPGLDRQPIPTAWLRRE